MRAAANQEKGQYDPAIADCTRALELRSPSLLAFGILREAYEGKADYDKAEAGAKATPALTPQSAIELNYRRNAFRTETSTIALADLDRSAAASSQLRGRAGQPIRYLHDQWRSHRALIDVERAISLNPMVDWLYSRRPGSEQNKVLSPKRLLTPMRPFASVVASKPRFLKQRGSVQQ